jgi:hypothetical protein
MLPVVPIVTFAAATVTAILTAATVHNTAETYFICSGQNSINRIVDDTNDNSIIHQYLVPLNSLDEEWTDDIHMQNTVLTVPDGKSKDDVINDLKSMKRKELLTLFKHCEMTDDLDMIEGEWDGSLLNNNLVLTSVSTFITNKLFGKNTKWNGKEFRFKNDKYVGINRFILNENNGESPMKKVHNFDYSISSSIFGNSSIRLEYARHQGLTSLWKAMVDEVRVIKVPIIDEANEGEKKFDLILLGAGSMAWSGGMYNCQPFCLH